MIKQGSIDRKRPNGYQYFNMLKSHLNNNLEQIFNGKIIYPRQLEIHLPGNNKIPCNFNCYHCQGRLLEKSLDNYEPKALKLLDSLEGRIPFVIYGGAYTEPLLNTHLVEFLELTKKHNSKYGIHTNGSLLEKLEKEENFLSTICQLADSSEDYISISLDAGNAESHCKTKRLKENFFDRIIDGLRTTVSIRGNSSSPSIRVCYLLNNTNSSKIEIENIIRIMQDIGVDSLRFSIPYDNYGKNISQVIKYKNTIEKKQDQKFREILESGIIDSSNHKPKIFYISPECQDVEKMNFQRCCYSYYQITLGADGYVYRCSSTATPSFKMNRLGKIPDNLDEFENLVRINHNPYFKPSTCIKSGARCNRIALEINLNMEKIFREMKND